jgi:hypothetical protein
MGSRQSAVGDRTVIDTQVQNCRNAAVEGMVKHQLDLVGSRCHHTALEQTRQWNDTHLQAP